MLASSQFFEDEQYITDIQIDATLQVVIEIDVTTQRLPVTVDSTSDQFTVCIQYRATGVTTGNIVRAQEANRHVTVRQRIASKILFLNQFLQFGRNYEFTVFGIFFFQNPSDLRKCKILQSA